MVYQPFLSNNVSDELIFTFPNDENKITVLFYSMNIDHFYCYENLTLSSFKTGSLSPFATVLYQNKTVKS